MLQITSSQRAKLRGLAMKLQPTAQLGKNGITDSFLDMIEDQLESRELVKKKDIGRQPKIRKIRAKFAV